MCINWKNKASAAADCRGFRIYHATDLHLPFVTRVMIRRPNNFELSFRAEIGAKLRNQAPFVRFSYVRLGDAIGQVVSFH